MMAHGSSVESEIHDVSRLNYGVYFRAKKQVALATDVWSQIFHVRIPTIPRGDLEHTAPDCTHLGLRYCRTARRLMMTAHKQHIQMTEQVRTELQHIIDVLPTNIPANERRQGKRALIPFGGWLLKGLFGTARDSDIKPIKRQVTRIGQGLANVARGLETENQRLAGYMTLANHRLDNLANITMVQEEAISTLTDEFNAAMTTTATLEHGLSLMLKKTIDYITLLSQLQEFRTGVEFLIQGTLTPIIIDKAQLRNTLRTVREHLLTKSPRLYIVRPRVSDYYNTHDFVLGRAGSDLIIQMHVPVSTQLKQLTLYEVEVFPGAVPGQGGHSTEVVGLPRYFLTAAGRESNYILPTQVDLRSDIYNVARNRDAFRSFKYSPSCISALFQDDGDLIQTLCQFRIRLQPLKPQIRFLNDVDLLVVNSTDVTVDCGRSGVRSVPPCDMCIHQVGCHCTVKQLAGRGYRRNRLTSLFILPKTATCDIHDNSRIGKSLVNLALLREFFNESELGNLAGNTTLYSELRVSLPKFKQYEHRFKELISGDAVESHNLQKFAKRVRKDSKVYHHLAEVAAENLDELRSGNAEYLSTSSWDKPDFYFKWISFICSLIALMIGLFLCYKVRIILAALALVKGSNAQNLMLPTALVFKTDEDPVAQVIMNVTDTNLVLEPHHHSLIALGGFLIACMIILFTYQNYQQKQRSILHIVLEIGNGKTTERIRCLQLPGSYFVYEFKATSYLKSIAVSLFPPKLHCSWSDFKIHNVLLNSTQNFPDTILISLWQAIRIKNCLDKGQFYCMALLECDSVLKLIDFELNHIDGRSDQALVVNNNYKNETIDNDLPNMTTVPSVLKLYPSLTELRDVP